LKNSAKRKNSTKRKSSEARKASPRDELLHGSNLVFRVALASVLVFGITFLYPIDKVYLPIEIPRNGEIASKDLVAPFDFPILKTEEELKRDRDLVIRNLRPAVVYDTILTAAINERIKRFFHRADSLMSTDVEEEIMIDSLYSEYDVIPESLFTILADRSERRKVENFCTGIIDSILSVGLIFDFSNLPFKESGLVTLITGADSKTIPREQLFDSTKAQEHISIKAVSTFKNDSPGRRLSVAVANHFLEPNLKFDRDITTDNKDAEIKAITPYKGWVYKDEKIIKANERVSDVHRDKLISLARYKRTQYSSSSFWQFVLPPLGRLFFVAFPILFFGFYLYYFRRKIFASNSALILFGILMASLVIILYLLVSQKFLSPYLVPITIASMLVTIAFDLETGLFLTFAASILVGVLSGFKLDVAFVGISAGTVATFSVRNVRHRHEFYRSIIYLSIVYFGIVYVVDRSLASQRPGGSEWISFADFDHRIASPVRVDIRVDHRYHSS
jgi:membrane-associated HD superfamily phosphohydrolase